MQALLNLRLKALAGCDLGSQHVRLLLNSSPFSEKIFGSEEVARIKDLAFSQVKPVQDLLAFGRGVKRPAQGGQGQTPKRKKSKKRGSDPPTQVVHTGAGRGRGKSAPPPLQEASWVQVGPNQAVPVVLSGVQSWTGPQSVASTSAGVRSAVPPPPRGRGRALGRSRPRSKSPGKQVGAQSGF